MNVDNWKRYVFSSGLGAVVLYISISYLFLIMRKMEIKILGKVHSA